jgi:5-methylcytosine-specific restriction protein B
MPRYCGDKSSKAAIDAVEDFKQRCLIENGSLFTNELLWTPAVIEELVIFFVNNLNAGEGDFIGKLKTQIQDTSSQAKQLASEMTWLMMLCPSSIGAKTSLETIEQVFNMSDHTFSEVISQNVKSKYLSESVLQGIGSAGPGYNINRWRELVYLITFAEKFIPLDDETKIELLNNYKSLSIWLEQIKGNESRQLRHMLLYLFFPDFHERIFGNTDRKAILVKLTDITSAQFNKLKVREIDEHLYTLRQQLETQFASKELDYYVPPMRALWKLDENDVAEPEQEYSVSSSTKAAQSTSLNQILYGPPGTGKTYTTIDKALEIIEPTFYEENRHDREVLKEQFDILIKANRIGFVTFHQSFSYEDFVEGIKASTGEDSQVSYDVEDGIFKTMSERASSTVGNTISADVFDDAVTQLQLRCEESDERLEMKTVRGKKYEIEFSGGNTFKVFPHSTENENPNYVASIANVRKLYLTGSKDGIYNSSYVEGVLNYLKNQFNLTDPNLAASTTQAPSQAFVLIIDEINRGNIANIFGELITLIEPSKRSGGGETIAVRLPYSKTKFSVPSNLYIIGTMNTADKSLAQVDIALRRRFEFHEMMTDYGVLAKIPIIDGINIIELVTAINERIELLYDREHTVGHSFFLPLMQEPTLANLSNIFQLQILPLLEEYFFEDWERVGQVLGDHLKQSDDLRFIVEKFKPSRINALMGSEWEPNGVQPYIRNQAALVNPEAYIGIYKFND